MLESSQRQQELESAINAYLSHADTYPIDDSLDLLKTGDYVQVFGWSSFTKPDDQGLYYFLAKEVAEQKLIEKVDKLFCSQISPATIRLSLSQAIAEITEFPFSTDEQETRFNDKLYNLLTFHFEKQYDAIVPLYQIESSVKFPLANAVLYPGGRNSELAGIANDDTNYLHENDREQVKNCSYLKIRVTGDNDSRLNQVDEEAQQSLQVLRYIYPWSEKDGKPYNASHGVSMWKQSWRTILFQRVPSDDYPIPSNSESPEGIFHARRIGEEFLSDAKKYFFLDEINCHFRNRDMNPVSQRFCRAFKYYDIASQPSDADVALANYIICVDILLPSGKADELRDYLISLIKFGEFDEGAMTLNDSDPDSTEWSERVRLTVSEYKEFYIIRDKVVHGNTMRDLISNKKVKKSRQIAKNSIRAFAKLSRAFNWQTDKEAKNWFKNPCKPPE